MKKLLRLAMILALVLVAGLVAVFVAIDSIARAAIETGATLALGVETTLDDADVGVARGEFAMSGLSVSNPEGYDASHFITLSDGRTAVSLGTLREDVVEIPTLELTGLDMQLEKKGGVANYDVILENLKRFESDDDGSEEAEEEDSRKFVVKQLVIRDVTVHTALLPVGGKLTRADLRVDELKLENIGSGGDGLPMGKLVAVIVQAVFVAIVEKGAHLPAELVAGISGGLESLGSLANVDVLVDGVGATVRELTGQLGEVGKGVGTNAEGIAEEVGKSIEKGIGNLFGGNRDNDKD